jgi:YHS domain-containing protein
MPDTERLPRRITPAGAVLLITLSCGGNVLAASSDIASLEFARTEAPQNIAAGGLAVHGYDVVAYFTLHRAVKGAAAYQAVYRGATYRFASAIHRTAFLARPERFVPQYGGYCAWTMRSGRRADIDPAAWEIVGGRLFLMHDRAERAAWMQDLAGNASRADGAWRRFARALPDR